MALFCSHAILLFRVFCAVRVSCCCMTVVDSLYQYPFIYFVASTVYVGF
ncbi:unnamed protein product [Acanthoscelides obtectus]|uniref:Uncharacterized protein n=1 Tax=Acanthoscelides obtectus TaxID=200917 RepID=A0A9P0LJB8_ACAOB|nr:unnamed protein product [Acanthoscelides obtectus]CAK1630234.1 hypothetical protein AOBTE_LOCUS6219 [Acanthoscelides obtectus]